MEVEQNTRRPVPRGRLHHVEIWVADLEQATTTLGWIFESLGYVRAEEWSGGASWQGAGEYLVLESSPDVLGTVHERRRPGLNHLAFCAGTPENVEALTRASVGRGFTLMFAELHPHAGGPDHYAAYLQNADGFEIELVAEGEAPGR